MSGGRPEPSQQGHPAYLTPSLPLSLTASPASSTLLAPLCLSCSLLPYVDLSFSLPSFLTFSVLPLTAPPPSHFPYPVILPVFPRTFRPPSHFTSFSICPSPLLPTLARASHCPSLTLLLGTSTTAFPLKHCSSLPPLHSLNPRFPHPYSLPILPDTPHPRCHSFIPSYCLSFPTLPLLSHTVTPVSLFHIDQRSEREAWLQTEL